MTSLNAIIFIFLTLFNLSKGAQPITALDIDSDLEVDPYLANFKQQLERVKSDFRDIEPKALPLPTTTNLEPLDEKFAKKIAHYAGAAYCKDNNLINWNCTHCNILENSQFHSIYHDKETDAKAVLVVDHYEESIILSFRGTSSIYNWFQNAKLLLSTFDEDLPGVRVHTGFKYCNEKLLKLYYEPLRELLNEYDSYKLIITGHSLGGSVAALATIKLKQLLDIDDDRLYSITYGQPRTGNLKLVMMYNLMGHNSIRVTNKKDIIPHLPSRLLGYYHNQIELWINFKDTPVLCSSKIIEDPKCSLSAEPFLNVDDHLTYWDIRLGGNC